VSEEPPSKATWSAGLTGRPILLAVGAIAAAAILAVSLWQFLRTPYVNAFAELAHADAVAIVGQLDRLKIPHRIADDGRTILVPEEQVATARMQILGGELSLKNSVGFELFNESDMGLTDFAQRINYQRALQGELARTIMSLAEIDSARVHLSLPERSLFKANQEPAKAAVTLRTKQVAVIDPMTVSGIQRLVASAVPGLSPENVAVLDEKGRPLSRGDGVHSGLHDEFGATYAARIRSAVRAAGIALPVRVAVWSRGTPGFGTPVDALGSPVHDPTRRQPLAVEILLDAMPDQQTADRIVEVARDAIGSEGEVADTVEIRVQPSLADAAPILVAPPAASNTKIEPARPEIATGSDLAIACGLGLLVLGLGGALIWTRRRSAREEAQETDGRRTFADHLAGLLQEEPRDAPSAP
jgi:flagellar M-ring protein FliF